MELDSSLVFPRWMQEFKRFQNLKSQFYLYGNVYDCFYLPSNFHTAENYHQLNWAKFHDICDFLIKIYLKHEGFEIIAYYDIVDRLTVNSDDEHISKTNIIEFLTSSRPDLKDQLASENIEEIEKSKNDTLSFFRSLISNSSKLTAGIINYASLFTSTPNSLEKDERECFLKLLKASRESKAVKEGKRNILILICDKLSDIPNWLLLENPLTKGIEVHKPNREERRKFFQVQSDKFYSPGEDIVTEEISNVFSDLTDGLANHELENLITISNQEKIHISDTHKIIDLFKYGTRENFWENLQKEKIENAESELQKRVLGQDHAIQKSVDIIRRAKLGLHSIDQHKPKNKPKGVLFFAGPTGVGKTELAKSLAELIFSDEDALLRFDMSEYNDSNSDVKLIGSPPGYVGYEEGGQLTSQVKTKPFSILLFDEIEKAHPVVFDKFLQILDDGRLTDGKGETVYFSETLIIFTSNLGIYKEDKFGRRIPNITPEEHDFDKVDKLIMGEIRNFFNSKLNRPEILNRFGDNFVVFDFIRPDVDKSILLKNLNTIQVNLQKQKNCQFIFDDTFIELFRRHYITDNLANGGRGINNRIETHIKNGITNFMFKQDVSGNVTINVQIDESDQYRVCFT